MQRRSARDPGGAARAPVRVQPGPRHRAADAARACRRVGGAGACRPKVAIVLFNLGGPDRPEAIKPFLVNLFTDPAILRVPFFVRPFLARAIARRRLEPAQANYALARRQVAVARADAAAGASHCRQHCRTSTPDASSRCATGIRSATRRRGRCATGSRTRSCCCRCIRSIPPPRPAVRCRHGARRRHASGWWHGPSALCCYPTDAAYVAATVGLLRTAYDAARAHAGSVDRIARAVLGARTAGG